MGRPRTHSDATIASIVDRYVAGDLIEKIAADHGVCVATICHYARAAGVPKRWPKGRPPKERDLVERRATRVCGNCHPNSDGSFTCRGAKDRRCNAPLGVPVC